jgi:poly(3-hydroxybutyrate) depolymerase
MNGRGGWLGAVLALWACGPGEPTQPPSKDTPRCTATDDHVSCLHQGTDLKVNNATRRVHWQIPAGDAPAAGWPVVTFFTGSFVQAVQGFDSVRSDAFGMFFVTKTVQALLAEGYAVLAPDTLEGGTSFWNTNIPPWATNWDGCPDDVFMKAIFAAIGDGTFGPLDSTRLYATGMSSGGFMTSRMAVSYPGKFKALAIHSASYATCSTVCDVPDLPADHPPTLFLHGEKDTIVPISTMRPYQMKLDAQGTPTSTEIDPEAGHEWLAAGVMRVPAWFDGVP